MRFEFVVIETQSIEKYYIVEANSCAEAEEKALIGETLEETPTKFRGVLHRHIDAGPNELIEKD